MTGDGGLYALKLKIAGRTRPYAGNVSGIHLSRMRKGGSRSQTLLGRVNNPGQSTLANFVDGVDGLGRKFAAKKISR